MSDLTGNPLVVDAADVAVAAFTVWKGAVHVYQVEFSKYNGDADTCTINKFNGKPFWSGDGAADKQTVRSGNLGWSNDGLTIPQGGITSGSVRIYIK